MDFTITPSDAEVKALEYAAYDPKTWIQNAATSRATRASREIIEKNTEHCNANSIQLAVGQDAQITQAYDLGVVKTKHNEIAQKLKSLSHRLKSIS